MKTTKQFTRIVSVLILLICCLESLVLGWGTAELIETDDAGHAWTPRVAMDSSGKL